MKYQCRSILIFFLLGFVSLCVNAQQTSHKHVIEMNYLMYLPQGYEADTIKTWPLMVFLHGAGETGTDVEKIKLHGPPKLIEEGHQFPFIIASLQTPTYGWKAENVMDLLMNLLKSYRVDNERIYLTGLSMGGYGTWDIAQKYPEMFAAIIPICGGGDTSAIWTLRYTPVWCFHGAKDDVVPIYRSEEMVDALKGYNENVKFTVYPEAGHDSWTETYNNNEIYNWLLSHRRFRYEQIQIEDDILKEYAGTYVSDKNDTISFKINGNELQSPLNNRIVSFKPASQTTFFIIPHIIDYIEFEKDDNKVVQFIMYNRKQKVIYKKI